MQIPRYFFFFLVLLFSMLGQNVYAADSIAEKLPEQAIAISRNKNTTAFYAQPTQKYLHGILGDSIEAEQLVVNVDGKTYRHTLSANDVFEDIRPRLFDVDNDGELEFITIRSEINNGAGIAILTRAPNETKVLYLPNQARHQIVGFRFSDNQLLRVNSREQSVDFSKPLVAQYPFQDIILSEDNCI